ncbi:hypothetical protein AC578_6058 [Pseudocercospora eumusae]|nr:hypothetical protein AC578_6058 [Pseudocercospora eumusae]
MTSTTLVHQGPSPEHDDYGLGEIAKHNAQVSTEQFPAYQEDSKGLGIYQDGYNALYSEEQSYIHNPPTPRSNTASEGIRTRSGRSTRGRTDSPFSTGKSRTRSPAPRSKKEKKNKLDKSKTPKLTAPLSVLTKDMTTPVRDIEAWVNRPREERLKEVEKKNGYIARPMNSFMLYRSAYANRTKQWCSQNNHQVVSAVAGESWPMEPEEVRNQFDEWAKTERQHHQEAHPQYKFSPSKSNNKRRRDEMSDDDEPSDLDDRDPDGEYRGSRNVRQRRNDREAAYLPSNVGFSSNPYYDHQLSGYEQSQYQWANPGRPLPSNVAYDQYGQTYDPRTGQYVHAIAQYQQNPYMQEAHVAPRVPTPGSLDGHQSLGGYGLPGGQVSEDLFSSSRTSTPMQHYNSYGQPMYPQYQTQHQQPTYYPVQSATPQPGSQQYEHAQYLTQTQEVIDPTLQAALDAAVAASTPIGQPQQNHFDDALADMTATDLSGMPAPEYYDQSTSPLDVNATLAPTWSPTQDLK